MSDFYARMRLDVKARMDELEPSVLEYERLARILHAIDTEDGQAPAVVLEAHGTGRAVSAPPSRGPSVPAARRGSEPRGRRARQVMEVIRAEPGLSLPQIAERLGSKPGYLYQLLPRLADQGLAKEQSSRWHPA
jgi:hypothetical protein